MPWSHFPHCPQLRLGPSNERSSYLLCLKLQININVKHFILLSFLLTALYIEVTHGGIKWEYR